jgi:cobalt-precorrin-5B (C1)-methyltransferase
MDETPRPRELRRGWTTGTCAAAATKAAYIGWVTGDFPDPVEISIPSGARPAFCLAVQERTMAEGRAGIVKDAGDDPDVTHGALVVSTVRAAETGAGVTFKAGPGVGTVTRAGLAIPVGEPAINPVPRQMIRAAIDESAAELSGPSDIEVEISIPGGEALARKTLNARLGIVGGLSILGTTGVVIPYSCSSWIHSIYRGIDVARAEGIRHVAGATGATSEAAVQRLHGLPDVALIDMGDFAGGMLKYLRRHPVEKVTVAGGFAKITKLGQGLLDLHSRSGQVNFERLTQGLVQMGGAAPPTVAHWNTANEVLDFARSRGLPLGDLIAESGWQTAARALRGAGIQLEIVVFDRNGELVGHAPFRPVA